MIPFDAIPDDLVPLTAYFKQLLALATREQPLLVFLDSVDQIGIYLMNYNICFETKKTKKTILSNTFRWSSGCQQDGLVTNSFTSLL